MTNTGDTKPTYSCHLEFAETRELSKAARDLLDEIISEEELEVTIAPGNHRFTVNGFTCITQPGVSHRDQEGLSE